MRKDKRRQSKLFRILGYIVAIVVNVIMLIFVNNILEFDWDFIKSSFSECLPWIVFFYLGYYNNQYNLYIFR